MQTELPTTLLEVIRYFENFENCRDFLVSLRWPDGKVTCPQCGSEHVTYLAKARQWKCYAKHSRPKFTLKTGTIFEDSPLPLDKWLVALWLVVNSRNGVSSCGIARTLGITQKSAWFMAHRLRFALHQGSFETMMSGHVEADETFIGGKSRNMHKRKRDKLGISQSNSMAGKVAVMGLLERHGEGSRVRTRVVETRRRNELERTVTEHVELGSNLYTDALRSYDRMGQKGYIHGIIDHAEKYVEGDIHTNGLENFWSLLKRALKGTYVSVEPFHLFRYLDEQMYRFNNRKVGDFNRFALAAASIVDRRLMWKQLTGQEDGAALLN
ncbi:MAG: IS1595 family transposase [Vicinamibacterales bacterium]